VAMHIIDRRLNPAAKAWRTASVSCAVPRRWFRTRQESLAGRDIKDVLEGGRGQHPLDGMNEPRFRREGGTRDMVFRGTRIRRRRSASAFGEGRGRASAPVKATARCVPVRAQSR